MTGVADWLAWGALFLPLVVLAWSGWQFVAVRKAEARQAEFENFFRTLGRVHNTDKSALLQRAAVFELRNYPHYREFVVRLCNNADRGLFGGDPETLKKLLMEEFALTAHYFEKTDNE